MSDLTTRDLTWTSSGNTWDSLKAWDLFRYNLRLDLDLSSKSKRSSSAAGSVQCWEKSETSHALASSIISSGKKQMITQTCLSRCFLLFHGSPCKRSQLNTFFNRLTVVAKPARHLGTRKCWWCNCWCKNSIRLGLKYNTRFGRCEFPHCGQSGTQHC